MASLNLEIDLEELLWDLSSREKEELVDLLYEEGYGITRGGNSGSSNISEWEFDKAITTIAENRLRLTPEEDEILRRIAARF